MTFRPVPERGLVEVVGGLSAERSSGVLTIARGKQKRLFCVVDGRVVMVASNVLEEQLAHALTRSGKLDAKGAERVVEEARSSGRKPDAVLREIDGLDETVLADAMTEHAEALLTEALRWPDAGFAFAPGRPKLEGAIVGSLAIERVALENTRQVPGKTDAVRIRIGPPGTVLRATPLAALRLELDDPGPSARHVLERAGDPTPIEDVVEGAPEGEDVALRAAYALLLCGWLERGDAIPTAPKREAEVTADEIDGWIARGASGNLYDVLGTERGATPESIRDAYYRLARRLHPDRIRSGPFANKLEDVEAYFSKVTEAFNTLCDPEAREHYDASLDEKLEDARTEVQDAGYVARQNYARGRALAERRKFADAVAFLENAVNLDPQNAIFHLELGRVLGANPRHRERAFHHLETASSLDPSSADAYVARAELSMRSGRPDEAGRLFREALRWDPDHLAAQEGLAAAES